VGSDDDGKYSKRVRDDGAVDADSVVALDDDSPKLAPSPPTSAQGKQPATPPGALPVLAPAPRGEGADKGNPARKQGRHIVCQLIGCGKKSAWALAGVSGVLALCGFTIATVMCMYKQRRRSFSYGRVRMDDDL